METKKVKKDKKKGTKKKKLVFIIDSSASSSSKKKSSSRKTKKKTVKKTGDKDISSLTFSITNPIEKEKTDLKKSPEIVYSMTESTIPLPSGRLNEKLIELMETLSNIMLKQGEPFRARAYQKAQEAIMAYPDDITGTEQLVGVAGIGPTIIGKINEYMATGTLRVIEREKNNPVNLLGDIYGIGPKKAKELVDKHGIKTIEQLRQNQQLLNDVQKVGLTYYEDILKRIPREEINQFNAILKSIQQSVKTPFHYEIVGSYRRGAESSGDIDVIITSDSATSVFKELIDLLIKENIIVEVLSRGATKCLVIAKVPGFDVYRRVDFLFTVGEEFPFAILYFTGSKIFNTVMRQYALQKRLTMNEHGLHRLEGKKKGQKVEHVFSLEKDIFDYLGLEYKLPEERKDGRAVVPQKKMNEMEGVENVIQAEQVPEQHIQQMLSKDKKVRVKKIVKKGVGNEIEDEHGELKKYIVDPVVKKWILDFKKNGISVLKGLNEERLGAIIRETNKAYYNEQPLLTDNEYDIVKEFIETTYPTNKEIIAIGAPVERNKVNLPYFMGSMDKIKPDTGVLASWTKKYKGPYVLSCKLDGVSGLYTTEGSEAKLYTRGDGKVGQDISHLIPYLRLPKKKGIVIRGEFIIPKEVFVAKYKSKFANPRNMVAGLINHKTIDGAIVDLHFVAYEVIKPVLKPSEQMEFLGLCGNVERVLYKIETSLSNEMLSSVLVDWRTNYIYEIDGIIVANDGIYERKEGNPEHAFAFKMVLSDQVAEAKVVDVIWSPSKDGYLKPRVQIEPIQLGGVRIEYATGFNGAFIQDNKIGIGAVIDLIRSGDVIPYIRKVIVPAEEAKMPSIPYKWNDTHIDVMLENIDTDETVREKNITGFFRGIGVEGLSSGNVARIIQAGFVSVPKIIQMNVDDFLKVEGFQMKMAKKLYDGIRERLGAASLVTIMSASNIFGRGFSEKRLELIMESWPEVLVSKDSNSEKIQKIAAIKGMATKSAEGFVERIPAFIEFAGEAGLLQKLKQHDSKSEVLVDTSHALFGKTVVFTGFRDPELQATLKQLGVKFGSSVSSKTFVVIMKSAEEDTGKVAEAKKLGVPVMTGEQFVATYLQ